MEITEIHCNNILQGTVIVDLYDREVGKTHLRILHVHGKALKSNANEHRSKQFIGTDLRST